MTESETDLATVLDEKRAELEAELAALAGTATEAGDISFGKRVGDGTSIAVERITQVAAHDRLQQMLADVRRAQDKLAAGSRDTCDVCDQPIGADRLEALPWATHCISCAGRR